MKQKELNYLQKSIKNSWKNIAPFWPLKHAISVNPLAGFEDLTFEDALAQAQIYFQQKDVPEKMHEINRQTIKWLQVFFDEGQSIITMPLRHEGLLQSVLRLLPFDSQLNHMDKKKYKWLTSLSHDSEKVIAACVSYLHISEESYEQFFTLLLTTLPGWASYTKYKTDWDLARNENTKNPVTKEEYVALRLVLTCLIWPEAKDLLSWHISLKKQINVTKTYDQVIKKECVYRNDLVTKLAHQKRIKNNTIHAAQFIFCIDVRSEPFRRALESQGRYETVGAAGFFGLPITISNVVTGTSYTSCPALVEPVYTVVEKPLTSFVSCLRSYSRFQTAARMYQAVKYTFTTPLALAETIGFAGGLWSACKTFFPQLSGGIKKLIKKNLNASCDVQPLINAIPFEKQVAYACDILQLIGLTKYVAPLVFVCGHRSQTQNNPHAALLECGACGGHPGGQNARVLAAILNNTDVRNELIKKGIDISQETYFLAAEHNTTTDEVIMYDAEKVPNYLQKELHTIKDALHNARISNTLWRSKKLGVATTPENAIEKIKTRSQDWAQVRPEWGLAGNASFIIGPRWLTKEIDLEGCAFLHSYEPEQDEGGALLTKIVTAPVIVGQWINMQYFFSTFDNVAFGSGSKITNNITGKIGLMQGNASDLMTGLSLQSVNRTDTQAYHELVRLTVVIYAPQKRISTIIRQQPLLQKLFGNGWMHLICIDPETHEQFLLQKDFSWEKVS